MLEPPPPLSTIDRAALFLDFDGTLVELAETPDAISVPEGLGSTLRDLNRLLSGRLALISGRSIGDLERHLRCAGIALSGSHGLELRLGDGSVERPQRPAALAQAIGRAARFAEGTAMIVEEKPVGFALHYRQAPEEAERVRAFMSALAEETGLALQHGKMVVELRPSGAHKGDAVRRLMREPEFAGARPLFVGDDLTDEDAFRAAAELGGAGILVGAERETAARWRLGGVSAVADWLGEALPG